ncbi:FAD-linked sulfhydryl oxidase ALR [Cylas formicarius]|uniref:FAD-linked sulfhydryl oxidase ALR n=1 Tax=Cylas formicarius TaxID=197179 RepID=UPI002958D28C|nr:FAD-linked sulfhydryl oxidase ALR [Cylas formicarius]
MNRRPSPLENEQCRQCSSFSDYLKSTKKKGKDDHNLTTGGSNQTVEEESKTRRTDCPLDKDELGNKTWSFLHTMAAKYPITPTVTQQNDMKTFFNVFSKFYPCNDCAKEFREELKVEPPRVESQEALSQWLCRIHNNVNVKIGKDVFDCTKVNERWRDGWLDGSCDW